MALKKLEFTPKSGNVDRRAIFQNIQICSGQKTFTIYSENIVNTVTCGKCSRVVSRRQSRTSGAEHRVELIDYLMLFIIISSSRSTWLRHSTLRCCIAVSVFVGLHANIYFSLTVGERRYKTPSKTSKHIRYACLC